MKYKPSIGDNVAVQYRYWDNANQRVRKIRTGRIRAIRGYSEDGYSIRIRRDWSLFSYWHFITPNGNKIVGNWK